MIRNIPLPILRVYVLISLSVFLVVQGFKHFSISGPAWMFHYLNDFLTIPIIATIGLHGVWFIKKDKSIRLNLFTILSLVALFSFAFEYYLPQLSVHYISDVYDVICYLLGGLLFYILQKFE